MRFPTPRWRSRPIVQTCGISGCKILTPLPNHKQQQRCHPCDLTAPVSTTTTLPRPPHWFEPLVFRKPRITPPLARSPLRDGVDGRGLKRGLPLSFVSFLLIWSSWKVFMPGRDIYNVYYEHYSYNLFYLLLACAAGTQHARTLLSHIASPARGVKCLHISKVIAVDRPL